MSKMGKKNIRAYRVSVDIPHTAEDWQLKSRLEEVLTKLVGPIYNLTIKEIKKDG